MLFQISMSKEKVASPQFSVKNLYYIGLEGS